MSRAVYLSGQILKGLLKNERGERGIDQEKFLKAAASLVTFNMSSHSQTSSLFFRSPLFGPEGSCPPVGPQTQRASRPGLSRTCPRAIPGNS